MKTQNPKKMPAFFSRKAQMSIFLILAIILLIGGALFLSLQKTEDPIQEAELSDSLGSVPTEFDPLKGYVESCIAQKGEEALTLLGEQGGYLSITHPKWRIENFKLASPTESDALLIPGSDSAIPYWWYLKSENSCKGKCELGSKRPQLTSGSSSIEGQIGRYVTDTLLSCLNNFEGFREQGFDVIESKKPLAVAKIGEEDVVIAVTYPLTLRKSGAEVDISSFSSRLDAPLKKMYDLSSTLTNLEMEYRYLEKHTLNLIVGFSGLKEDKLPPMSDLTFDFGGSKSWSQQKIKSQITSLISGYTQLFMVEGTSNFERNLFSDPLAQRLYDSTLIPRGEEDFSSISASFAYLDSWPLYFDLNCDGDSCRPDSANSLLSTIGLQNYRFAYDVSYPVMIELYDPSALNGKGYTFRFALESNIRNNEPMKSDFNPLERAELGEISTLLCDENQRTSGEISITSQSPSKSPIPNTQILYTVLDNSCYIGTSSELGVLNAKLPGGVVGGALSAIAEDHIGKSIEYTPSAVSEKLTITLDPIQSKNITVKKKGLRKEGSGWQFSLDSLDLSKNEKAIVSLKRIPSSGEEEFFTIGEYEGVPTQIRIAPGTYEADISIILEENVRIPSQTKCSKGGLFSPEVCYTIPEVDFGNGNPEPLYLAGGFKGNITIPHNRLSNSKEIIFYAIVPDLPKSTDDLSTTQNIEGLSKTYGVALQPTFE